MASIKPNIGKGKKVVSYRWRACTGRDELGRQIFATKTVRVEGPYAGLTPKKLENAMQLSADEWEKSVLSGAIQAKKKTFGDFVANVWMPLQVKDGQHRPSTIAFYEEAATPIVKALGSKDIESITPVDIQKYLHALAETCSAATVARHYRVIKMIFRFAHRVDAASRNVMEKVTPPKRIAKKKIEFLTQDEARRWIAAVTEYATPM